MLLEKTLFRLSQLLLHREEQKGLPCMNRKCDRFTSYTIPNPSLIIVAAAVLRDEYATLPTSVLRDEYVTLSTSETTATVSSAPSD